jgi:hypothetical protein
MRIVYGLVGERGAVANYGVLARNIPHFPSAPLLAPYWKFVDSR